MKRITKLLSVFLVAVVLLSVLNIGTLAASYTPITVGEVITVSADENYGKLALEFIPEESAAYAFYSMGDFDTCGYIFDSDMNLICESDDHMDLNFYAVCNMTAGETYYLRSELYSNDGDVGEYSVTVEKVNGADEIFIYHGGETTGYVGHYLSLECFAEPEEAYAGELLWESDNEDVAVIDYYDGSYCDVFLTGVGAANITVMSEYGLYDTVEIKAVEIPEIIIDEPQYLTFGPDGGQRYFTFTPESDGEYAVYTDGAFVPFVSLSDSNYDYVGTAEAMGDGGDVLCIAELSAGETYTIDVSVYFESPDFELYVTRCTAAEGIEILTFEENTAYAGMTVSLSAAFSPEISVREDCTWSSDNENVAMVVYEDGAYCDIKLIAPGKANITVTTENGLSDTVEIECLEVPVIRLDEIKTVTSAEGEVFAFVPEKSGNYSFISESECAGIGAILDSEWNALAASDIFGMGSGFSAQADLWAGETYYLYAICADAEASEPFEVKITKSVKATEVTLSCGTELYGYVGETITLEAIFGDKNVEIEDCYFSKNALYGVVSLDPYGNLCDVYLEGPGTASVFVTTSSGLMAICTVYIEELEVEEILLDEEYTVEVGKYANDYFWFRPQEDGTYSFISNGNIDTYATLMDWDLYEYDYDDDSGEGYNFCLQLEMEAGEEYVFRTSYFEPYTDGDTYTVKIIKSPKAEEMILVEEGTVNAAVGSVIEFVPEFLPVGAEYEEVYFRVSDRSVIEVLYEDEYSCAVIVNGEGTAILEAHTDSGLYSEVTIVAGSPRSAGDVNGDGTVNAIDSNILKRFIAGEMHDINEVNADMDEDGKINSIDSNLLKRLIAGM